MGTWRREERSHPAVTLRNNNNNSVRLICASQPTYYYNANTFGVRSLPARTRCVMSGTALLHLPATLRFSRSFAGHISSHMGHISSYTPLKRFVCKVVLSYWDDFSVPSRPTDVTVVVLVLYALL